ncbi:MAG: hypothetical protein ABI645_05380 [Pseudomonadota bacterium]
MTRYLISLAAGLLSACSSFTANWYHVAPDESSSGSELIISILNRSDRTCSVTRVSLNPGGHGEESDLAWIPESPITLAPGEFFWIAGSNFKAKSRMSFRPGAMCTIPTALTVNATGCTSIKESTRFEISFQPRLPGAMPDGWRTGCDAAKR